MTKITDILKQQLEVQKYPQYQELENEVVELHKKLKEAKANLDYTIKFNLKLVKEIMDLEEELKNK